MSNNRTKKNQQFEEFLEKELVSKSEEEGSEQESTMRYADADIDERFRR